MFSSSVPLGELGPARSFIHVEKEMSDKKRRGNNLRSLKEAPARVLYSHNSGMKTDVHCQFAFV